MPLEELLLRIYAAGIYGGDLRGCKSDGCSVSKISCCWKLASKIKVGTCRNYKVMNHIDFFRTLQCNHVGHLEPFLCKFFGCPSLVDLFNGC